MGSWKEFLGGLRPLRFPTGRSSKLLGGLLGVAVALPLVMWLWGYTVDDALIAARVAAHLASGRGHRFNLGGPIVDAVTPLGWAYVIAPFARSGPLAALGAAKWVGAISWLLAAAWLGAAITRSGRRSVRFVPLLVLAVCAPLAAWAVSGMETGVVTLLATLALSRRRTAVLAAGLAAAWRPELVPWAVVLSFGAAIARRESVRGRALALALALGPAIGVALIRAWAFGRVAPLAAFAKPSDLSHGLRYACGALAFTGPPWLLLAPSAARRLDGHARAVVAAVAAHVGAVMLAGGDWMSLYRLMVPVLPGALWAGALLAERAALWATALRTALALAACMTLLVVLGPAARRVGAERAALIRTAAPLLRGARAVAALDVGWVGAATPGRVVDLAGVTDREVAMLPGGHTSKRIPLGFLRARGVDALVLLLAPGQRLATPWWRSRFARAVEQRVAAEAARELRVAPVGSVRLLGSRERYVILRSYRAQREAAPNSKTR